MNSIRPASICFPEEKTMPPRFDLLDDFSDAPQLAKLARSAAAMYPQDPNIVLIRLRQFGEAVLNYLAVRRQLDTGGLDKQHDLLMLLHYKLLVPDEIIRIFNALRIKGNRAVHDLHEDAADAAANLQHAQTLSQWLHDTFILPERFAAEQARREAEQKAAEAAEKQRAALERKNLAKHTDQERIQAGKARKQAAREERKAKRTAEKAGQKAEIQARRQQRAKEAEEQARLRRKHKQDYQRRLKRAQELHARGERYKAQKDYANAVKCFAQAAEIGLPRSMVQMGLSYSNGWLGERNAEKTFYWYNLAAREGDIVGINNLATCYANGIGTPTDPETAVRLYHRSARQGYAIAQHNLGSVYRKGKIIPRDLTRAVFWYKRAATQGVHQSDYWLGIIYAHLGDPERALAHIRAAAEHGEPNALEWLARHEPPKT